MTPKKPRATPAEFATFWAAVQRKANATGRTAKRPGGRTDADAPGLTGQTPKTRGGQTDTSAQRHEGPAERNGFIPATRARAAANDVTTPDQSKPDHPTGTETRTT